VINLSKRMRDELGVTWELVPRACLPASLAALQQSWARQLKMPSDELPVRTVAEQIFRSVAEAEPALGPCIELTLFQGGFRRTETLERLVNETAAGALPLLQTLWAGEDSLLQRLLLRAHSQDDAWPSFGLTTMMLEVLQRDAPEAAARLVQNCGRSLLWMPAASPSGGGARNFKEDAANVPLLAGILGQMTGGPKAWCSPEVLARIRQIRAFDPIWFEVAHRAGLMLALMLEQDRLAPRRAATGIPYRVPKELARPAAGATLPQAHSPVRPVRPG
jgi:hypothetical protein